MKPLLFFIFTIYSFSIVGQVKTPEVFPAPQEITFGKEKAVELSDFLFINHQADADAVKLLLEITENKVSKKAVYKIVIGESKHSEIKKMNLIIPQYSGGYFLSITPKNVILAGFDSIGTFYAVQTFRQLLRIEKGRLVLPIVTIRDYPSLSNRGVVEGFFGESWTSQERIRQLEFYGRKKMNTYIYAPKDGIYHGYTLESNAVPYTKDTRKNVRELINTARKNKVNLVWAIHVGKTVDYSNKSCRDLIDKFEIMYNLGIRSFGLFFDEIPQKDIDANKQVVLLNDIVENFMIPNKCGSLYFCPSIYNKTYIKKDTTYFQTIKEKLTKDVFVLWTGDHIVSDISTASLQWATDEIGRKPFVWWNYPVNDFVKNKLLLGRVYGLEVGSVNFANGFVSNAMIQPEASKIALSGIADFCWNSQNFNSYQSWQQAIKELVPNCAEAFQVFAKHNADHGQNFMNYRREESIEIKPILDTFFLYYTKKMEIIPELYDSIVAEFDSIKNSAQFILDQCDNQYLLAEIMPWLQSFREVGKLGKNAMEICKTIGENDREKTWKLMAESQDIILALQMISKEYAEDASKKGINTAQTVITPFIEKLMIYNVQNYYGILSDKTMPKRQFISSNQNIENPYSAFDNNNNTYTYIYGAMKEGDYFGVNLGDDMPVYSVTLTQGYSDDDVRYALKGQLEYSKDGKLWQKMGPELSGMEIYYYGETVNAQYIRYKIIENNPKNSSKFIAIRHLKMNISPLKPQLYSNISLDSTSIETNTNKIRITIPPTIKQWSSNDYIGIYGVENLIIDTLVIEDIDKNVVLETSSDGLQWNDIKLLKKNKSFYTVFKTHRERFFRCRNIAKKSSKMNFTGLTFTYSKNMIDDSNVMFDKRLFTYETVELSKKYTIPVEKEGSTVMLLLKDPIVNNTVFVYAVSKDNTVVMIGELSNGKLFYEFSTPLEYIQDIIFEGGKTEELLSISEIIVK